MALNSILQKYSENYQNGIESNLNQKKVRKCLQCVRYRISEVSNRPVDVVIRVNPLRDAQDEIGLSGGRMTFVRAI